MRDKESPVVELRRYTLRDEDAREYFLRRSRETTFPLFAKHGFRVERFWADAEDPLTIYYLVGWDDEGQMRRDRAAFEADPAWRAMVDAPGYRSPVASSSSTLLRTVVEHGDAPGSR